MKTFRINGEKIVDWDSFHNVFSKELGFPEYYGRNMNAWNDCMSDLVEEGELISIVLQNVTELKEKNSEIFSALNESAAFVNYRFSEAGEKPLIVLSYYD